MEAVDELETKRDQQRHKEQQERRQARYLCTGRINVGPDAVGDEYHDRCENPAKYNAGKRINRAAKIWSLAGCGFNRPG